MQTFRLPRVSNLFSLLNFSLQGQSGWELANKHSVDRTSILGFPAAAFCLKIFVVVVSGVRKFCAFFGSCAKWHKLLRLHTACLRQGKLRGVRNANVVGSHSGFPRWCSLTTSIIEGRVTFNLRIDGRAAVKNIAANR